MPVIYPSSGCDMRFEYPYPWECKAFFNPEPTKIRRRKQNQQKYPQHISFWRLLDFKKFTDPPEDEVGVMPPAPGDPPLERDPPRDEYLYYVPKATCKYLAEYTDRKNEEAEIIPPRGVEFVKLTMGYPPSPRPKSLATLRLERAMLLAAKRAAKAAKKKKKKGDA